MNVLLFVADGALAILRSLTATVFRMFLLTVVIVGGYIAWEWWDAGARLWNGAQLR